MKIKIRIHATIIITYHNLTLTDEVIFLPYVISKVIQKKYIMAQKYAWKPLTTNSESLKQYTNAPIVTSTSDPEDLSDGQARSMKKYSIIPTVIGVQARKTITVSTFELESACIFV